MCQDFNRQVCNRPACKFIHLTDGELLLCTYCGECEMIAHSWYEISDIKRGNLFAAETIGKKCSIEFFQDKRREKKVFNFLIVNYILFVLYFALFCNR